MNTAKIILHDLQTLCLQKRECSSKGVETLDLRRFGLLLAGEAVGEIRFDRWSD